MRLTDYTDYSLRTLIYLGLNRNGLVTIQEIAKTFGISKSHLMKVVHQLGVAGLVDTVRGRNGGLRLKKEPGDINLGLVVRGAEADFVMVECFDQAHNNCILAPACELKHLLRRATNAYFDVLDGVTLAQLLQNGPKLRKLANIPVRALHDLAADRSG